jgi:hypothetical protein
MVMLGFGFNKKLRQALPVTFSKAAKAGIGGARQA